MIIFEKKFKLDFDDNFSAFNIIPYFFGVKDLEILENLFMDEY